MGQIRAWREAAPGFVRRQAKTFGQTRYGWGHPKRVCFVFGCQRSGTKMLMRILDRSPETRIYHENHAVAFSDFQLRSDPIVRALVRLNPAPSQIFKPICDSHRADHLLARFPEARGLWMYRSAADVANSATQKWGRHQCEIIGAVVNGGGPRGSGGLPQKMEWGWRTERVSPAVAEDLRRVWRPDLTEAEGALLFWYLRNSFYFALGLERHPRMLLVRYEDLVTRPDTAFPDVFTHVGAAFDPAFLERVHASSVGRRSAPDAHPAIRALCEGLQARLDARVASVPAHAPAPMLVLIDTLGTGGAERYAVTISNWAAGQGGRVVLAAAPGALSRDLAANVAYEPVPTLYYRRNLPSSALHVRRIVRRRQPEVIVSNSVSATLVARLARGRNGAPIVAVAHGWPEGRYRFVGPLLRAADRVVAVSPEVKARLVEAGLDPVRCDVVANGVDCSGLGRRTGARRDAARVAMGAGPSEVLVINVGRLSPQKAQHHVLAVAARLRNAHPELRYAIAGTGAREQELAELIRAQGLEDRVRLLGLRTDVSDLLGSADIYLSCSDWEGMPLSTIEAMASGLPTVATRTEGAGELLTAECGFIVPVGDTGSMARAIGLLATDPDLRARMGRAADTRARALFGHERMARELMGTVERTSHP